MAKTKKPKQSAPKKARGSKKSSRPRKKPAAKKPAAKKAPKKTGKRSSARRPFVFAGKQGLYFEDAFLAPRATRRRASQILKDGHVPGGGRKLSTRERTALGAVAAGSLPIRRNVISMLGTLGFNPITERSSSAEGPLLRFLDDKPIGYRTSWGALPEWVRDHELARKTAEEWAKRNGVAVAKVPIEKVAPRGIFNALGMEVQTDYAPEEPSKYAGEVLWHYGGDQGPGKKPTRPTEIAQDASTGLIVHVPRKGSNQHVKQDGIHG